MAKLNEEINVYRVRVLSTRKGNEGRKRKVLIQEKQITGFELFPQGRKRIEIII